MNILNLIFACFLLNVFAYLTIKLRPRIYGVELFKPMIWNFKLSLIPFLIQLLSLVIIGSMFYISSLLNIRFLGYIGIIIFFILQCVWLVFLPNSTYLITELNLTHREVDSVEVPIWYDIVSVLSFALSGILNTLVNIVIIQLEIIVFLDPNSITKLYKYNFLLSTFILTIIVSIGVYLGRSIRFNTWDLLHPRSLIKKLVDYLKKDGEILNFVLFVVFHTFLLMILFVAFGIVILF